MCLLKWTLTYTCDQMFGLSKIYFSFFFLEEINTFIQNNIFILNTCCKKYMLKKLP